MERGWTVKERLSLFVCPRKRKTTDIVNKQIPRRSKGQNSLLDYSAEVHRMHLELGAKNWRRRAKRLDERESFRI